MSALSLGAANQPARGTRAWLVVVVMLLVFDGALRKWVFTDAEQVVFVVKDVLLFAVLGFSFLETRLVSRGRLTNAARLSFMAYAFWVTFSAFNPALPNILVGMWGVKTHLLYAGLIVLVPLAFRDLGELFRMLERGFPWVVTPVVLVALVQLVAPADSFINQAVRGGAESVHQFGYAGLVRVTGTFSYLSGMASFVQTTTLLGIALFLGGSRSKPFLFGLALALLAVPLTGSRSVVVALLIGGSILLASAAVCRLVSGSYAVLATVVLAGFGFLSLHSQGAAWQALLERTEYSQGDQNRAVTVFTNAFEYFDAAGPAGFGAGSANFGAPALATGRQPFSWLPMGDRFEDESGRIVIELGVIGWFLSLGMRATFLWWAFSLARGGATRQVRVGAVVALPVVALGFYLGSGVFAPPITAAAYWFAVAVLGMAEHEHRIASRARWSHSQVLR